MFLQSGQPAKLISVSIKIDGKDNNMKKHPLLFNSIFTMAIQIIIYLIKIFEVQIIEPMLQAMGVRSEGILPPTAVVRLIVFSAVLIAAAIAAGIIRSKVYFWIPSFLLIFICFAIFYPDNLSSCIYVPFSASALYYYPYINISERAQTKRTHTLNIISYLHFMPLITYPK